MFFTVLYFAAGVLALVAALLLFLPLSYSLSAAYKEAPAYLMCVDSPLFRFVKERRGEETKTRLVIMGLPLEKKLGKKRRPGGRGKKKSHEDRALAKSRWLLQVRALLTRGNVNHVWRFVAKLLATVKPRHLMLKGRVGLDEPELNAWLLAVYYALKSLYAEIPLQWEPVWDDECVELEGAVEGSLIPAILLFRLALFMASRKTIRILREIYRIRRRRKKVAAVAT
ncbi:MAG: hypothetical protein GX244_10350 [Firmicutes bacterium]|nr:hypothetical protein [Bacillota bacterium]